MRKLEHDIAVCVPDPLDSHEMREIAEAVRFVLYVPSGRNRVAQIIRDKERIEGVSPMRVPKRRLFAALERNSAQELMQLAADPDEVDYEIVTQAANEIKNRAVQVAPLLMDLVLIPGEEIYARKVGNLGFQGLQNRFNQGRRFLTELLDTVPQAEVEGQLRTFIGQIKFKNDFLITLSPDSQYELLFMLLTSHSVFGEPFQAIHESLSQKPSLLPPECFPSRQSLAIDHRLLIFALSQKWPGIAEKYSLEIEICRGPVYAPGIMKKIKKAGEAAAWLDKRQADLSPEETLIIKALASNNLSLIISGLRMPVQLVSRITRAFPFMTGNFIAKLKESGIKGTEGRMGKRMLDVFKLAAFSEGRTLNPEESTGKREVFEMFMQLVEVIKNGDYKQLDKPLNRGRITAIQHLQRLLGADGIKAILDGLPRMTIEERLELPKIWKKRAMDELGLAESVAKSDVHAISALIIDIVSGKRFPEILYKSERGKLSGSADKETADNGRAKAIDIA